MILQLNPSMLVETPLGRGQALFIIDYGMHQNTCWVVALENNGVVKHFDCNDVILSTNYTYHVNMTHNTNDGKYAPAQQPNANTIPLSRTGTDK